MRESENRFARDIALRQFLRLLTWLRTVLVQDAALLFVDSPHATLFKYAPFNSPVFREFAAASTANIVAAEEQARVALQNLPQQMAQTMQGILTGHALELERTHAAHRADLKGMREDVTNLMAVVEIMAAPKRARKKGVYDSAWYPFYLMEQNPRPSNFPSCFDSSTLGSSTPSSSTLDSTIDTCHVIRMEPLLTVSHGSHGLFNCSPKYLHITCHAAHPHHFA